MFLVCVLGRGWKLCGRKRSHLLHKGNYKREGKGSQYFEPLFIQYISVRKELLDIIELQVAVTTGKLVKFGEGNTTVTLNLVRP